MQSWTLRLVVLVPELVVEGLLVAEKAVELDLCCLVGSLCVVRSCPLTAFSFFVHRIHKAKLIRAL